MKQRAYQVNPLQQKGKKQAKPKQNEFIDEKLEKRVTKGGRDGSG